MAFSTELVMGAGGGGADIEAIPVSMSGAGSNVTHPLATVDAGERSIILLSGLMTPDSTTNSWRPYLSIGGVSHTDAHTYLTGPTGWGIGGVYSGEVAVAVLTRHASYGGKFNGTLYVARL